MAFLYARNAIKKQIGIGDKMAKDTKLLFINVIDGSEKDIRALTNEMSKIKNKLPYDIEFVISNDNIQLITVKQLLKEIAALYKKENMIKKGK